MKISIENQIPNPNIVIATITDDHGGVMVARGHSVSVALATLRNNVVVGVIPFCAEAEHEKAGMLALIDRFNRKAAP